VQNTEPIRALIVKVRKCAPSQFEVGGITGIELAVSLLVKSSRCLADCVDPHIVHWFLS
jgi:hypothetical protein